VSLHASQLAAIAHFTSYARSRRDLARSTLDEIISMSNLDRSAFHRGVQSLRKYARVVLHFHPDRLNLQLRTVAESMLESGSYENQFQTLISNGSVSAFPGGARDLWEKRLFGGAYHRDGATLAHRPKYGALDVMRHSDGAAPRFGSCYFVLVESVAKRSTLTYLDSHDEPLERGTVEELDDVVAAMFKESFTRDFALGETQLRPAALLDRLHRLADPYADPATRASARNLDHYIEAQVHGPVRLSEDVERLVVDPSFQNTATGQTLATVCDRYDIEMYWHRGFKLPVAEVPSDFRGSTMPSLAARVAADGVVDAAAIGNAVMSLKRAPEAWAGRGEPARVLQELKLLWHVLVRFGH